MPRYKLRILLDNRPEALAKMLLLFRQGQLSLVEAHMELINDGEMQAHVVLEGRPEKVLWLVRKMNGFPFFHSCSYEPSQSL